MPEEFGVVRTAKDEAKRTAVRAVESYQVFKSISTAENLGRLLEKALKRDHVMIWKS